MEKLEDIFVCPSCKGRLSPDAETLSCPACSRKYRRARSVCDFRTVLNDPVIGWNAEVIDIAYEGYDGGSGFKDRRAYAASEGIPKSADEYLESEKELKIKDFVRRNKPSRLLDLGCGTGWFSFEMAECSPGTAICGIDISTYRTDLFQVQIEARACGDKLFTASANAENLPFKEDFFDIAVMNESIEHLLQPSQALAETIRILKPGGYLIITTPSKPMTWFWKTAALVPTLLKRIIRNEPLLRKGNGNIYEKLLSCSELAVLSRKAGFSIERWEKVIFLPHESYLQFIPGTLLGIMISFARILGKIPFLGFLGLHHLIILRKRQTQETLL